MRLKASLKKAVLGFFFRLREHFLMYPRRPGRIVFSQARNRCSGNSRALFEYCVANNLDASWLYSTTKQIACLDGTAKKHCVPRSSWKGLYLSLTCQVAVISHGGGDFGWLWHIVKHGKIVNVWHGTAIKNTGLTDNKLDDGAHARIVNRDSKYWDMVSVSSEVFRYYFSSSFRVDLSKVVVTGDPKHDNYLKRRRELLKLREAVKQHQINILYAPTFRDWDQSSSLWFPFAGDKLAELQVILQGCPDVKFSLRPHPNDKESTKDAISLEEEFPGRFELLSVDILDDIDERLAEFDAIITDYSSIYMEPLLADVPVIFIAHDIERYESERGLAYPYDLVTPGPKVRGWKELKDAISSAVDGASEYKEQRKFVRDMFFKYQDCNSCERICALLGCNGKNPSKRCTP